MYEKVDRIIPKLTRAATIVDGKLSEVEEQSQGDYIVDEKAKTVTLTEQGTAHCESLLGVDNMSDATWRSPTTSTRRSRRTTSSPRTWTTS